MATQSALKERTGNQLREPRMYKVIMLNDDFTTMEFVVQILVEIFHKDAASAESIMLTVHRNGRAVVGIYTYDVAVTKITAATRRAREEGFPFRMVVEEA